VCNCLSVCRLLTKLHVTTSLKRLKLNVPESCIAGDYGPGRPKQRRGEFCRELPRLSPGKQRFQGEDNIREKRSVLRARRQPNSVATSFVMLRNELLQKHPFRVQLLHKKMGTFLVVPFEV
jgi:hypothetical protein